MLRHGGAYSKKQAWAEWSQAQCKPIIVLLGQDLRDAKGSEEILAS